MRFQRSHLRTAKFYTCIQPAEEGGVGGWGGGARADSPPGDKILIVTKTFYYSYHTL